MFSVVHNLFDWAPLGIPAFIFVVTFVVFFHELGHFLVARACGVAIKTFSIGFGGEIVGWNDKKGTRWKISWLPFGGYVMFAGDENAASVPDRERLDAMSEEEKAKTFTLKPLWQRALVVAAGPVANFILAFIMFAVLLSAFGAMTIGTKVGAILTNSPAAAAGIKPGDRITAVDGEAVRMFYGEMQGAIRKKGPQPITLGIEREGRRFDLVVTPRLIDAKDVYGAKTKAVAIGIMPGDTTPDNTVYLPVPLAKVPQVAAAQCWGIVDGTFTYLWRIVSHKADASQLGGPIGIAQAAKSAASHGFYDLLYLVSLISVSIGLINLFPIPLLDGGHLLYYACEGVLGRPLNERAQEVGFRLGFAVLITLMIFLTWNDLIR
jgi:regulator of sigma E protease